MIASRQRQDHIAVGPKGATVEDVNTQVQGANVVVMGSGCAGLIYFTDSRERMSYEQIQDAYPQLIPGLIEHPGVGFVLVRSGEQGDLALNARGVHFLEDGHVDRKDPLAVFGPNAAVHLRRESSFSNCPDLIVNTAFDPETEQMCCFENQASHHGGLGGPQNHAFVLAPAGLSYDGRPVVGATGVYRLLRAWRAEAQGLPGPA
jgi:hypothetical protein